MDRTAIASIRQVRDQILALVEQISVETGGRVPTERALQEAIGVSRSRIRDALAALEVEGVVTRQVGSGTYLVRANPVATPALPESKTLTADAISPAQLLEARLAFETGLQPLIVANATTADLKGLESILLKADRTKELAEFERYDMEFHTRLADAAHNELMSQFAELLSLARGAERSAFKRETSTQERLSAYQRQHWAILHALKRRNAEASSIAVRDHLRFVRDVLFEI
ncbi:MAG: FadR/GntR family transcriptional regulator [Variibacter sp.]